MIIQLLLMLQREIRRQSFLLTRAQWQCTVSLLPLHYQMVVSLILLVRNSF